jgi:predicted membrane channel-forming protein YqfA (hemolysin III family)
MGFATIHGIAKFCCYMNWARDFRFTRTDIGFFLYRFWARSAFIDTTFNTDCSRVTPLFVVFVTYIAGINL